MRKGILQKKIAWFLCFVLMISILSACSSSKVDEDTGKNNTISSTQKAESEDEADSESESVEVGSSESESQESEKTDSENSEISKETEGSETPSTSETPSSSETSSEEESESPEPPSSSEAPSEEPTPEPPSVSEAEQLAQAIVDEIIKPGMSEFEKAITIHDWIVFNIDYDHTYSVYDIENTLKKRTAVCQGYALTFELMAQLAGLDAGFIVGTADNGSGSGYQGHGWNRVKIDGEWYNVDTTWDDPSSPGKDPNDHSGNNYNYFLVSEEKLSIDHRVTSVDKNCGNCPKDYDRLQILRYGVVNSQRTDVGFATNLAEINAAVKKFVEADCSSFWLWYYDGAVTNENLFEMMNSLLSKCEYPAFVYRSYYPENNLTKCEVYITPISEWNKIPLVKTTAEFKAYSELMKEKGVEEFKVRYENTDPNFDYECIAEYGFAYPDTYYNDKKSYILKVFIF